MKKYELTEYTKTLANGAVLHRIRALKTFRLACGGYVPAGDLGGWVENEDNLSQTGSAWVSGDAWVSGNAKVYGDARVYGNANVYGNAKIYGNACVYKYATVSENARVYGEATVCRNATVSGDANVYGNAWVIGDANVYGKAKVYDDATVDGNAMVFENAQICGKAYVSEKVMICGDARIKGPYDYAVFKNTWSSGRIFVYTRSNRMWKVGCFYGTGEELIEKAYKDSELSGRCYKAIVKTQEAIDKAVEQKTKP